MRASWVNLCTAGGLSSLVGAVAPLLRPVSFATSCSCAKVLQVGCLSSPLVICLQPASPTPVETPGEQLIFLLPSVSLALVCLAYSRTPFFASGYVKTPPLLPLKKGAGCGPCLQPLTLPSEARTPGSGTQEGLTPLTSQLLHTGQWPCPILVVHSALVQDPVHSKDVHLRLLDSPCPRSGSVLEPP